MKYLTTKSVPMRPIISSDKEEFESTLANTKAFQIQPNLRQFDLRPLEIKAKMWGNVCHQSFCGEINKIYDEVVHFRRNIFILLGQSRQAVHRGVNILAQAI